MSSIDGTLLYGLLGNPVTHSLSPLIMNRAFTEIGMDAVYVAMGVRPSHLANAINGLSALGAMGFNVTYPYKEEVLYHLDIVASDAELIHAVNTVVLFEDEIQGYNTDAPGTATALEIFADITLENNRAFIYGAGGSARAAAFGLLERGVERVTFAVRSTEKAEMTIDRFSYSFPEQTMDFVILNDKKDKRARQEAFCEAEIIINATPVGMEGVAAEGRLIEDLEWINARQCLFDFVYQPRSTEFLKMAREGGGKPLGGIALLVSQAAESFRLWTDNTFDIQEMAETVELFSDSSQDAEGVN